MFYASMEAFADDQQWKKWGPLLKNYDIHGCYAQTELGHGSDVAALETTATLDLKTDEFVLHTPSISATKWWPGELGRQANHAVVFARVLIPYEDEIIDYGLGQFIV